MSEAATGTAAGIAIGSSGQGVAAGASAVQVATVFFVAMGMQPELLFCGMWGALASIIFFGRVPLENRTWQARVMQTFQRLLVVIVSSVMAAYCAPMFAHLMFSKVDESAKALFFSAFLVGAAGQVFLRAFINKYTMSAEHPHLPTQPHPGK